MQVFEEVQNLCFGLASRGVPWAQIGGAQQIAIWSVLFNKLSSNLFLRSRHIAESLQARLPIACLSLWFAYLPCLCCGVAAACRNLHCWYVQ